MKKFIVATLALGLVCVFSPSAMADSFGYQASGSIVAASPALGANTTGFSSGISALPGDGRFLFDNLVNPGKFGDRTSDADVLVEIRGHELNLLSSHLGGYRAAERGNGNFYLADGVSYHSGNEITKGNSELAAETSTLAATPEPGSLLLLGTGLLCMAFFLFRKSAKHSTES